MKSLFLSDRIMVMAGGELAEFDTPDALLGNKNSLFYKLVHGADHRPTKMD
jgi:ABC-type multidrug transport system fused ATPase/permease subunit